MEELDSWKLVAVLVIFVAGLIGSASPLLTLAYQRRLKTVEGATGGSAPSSSLSLRQKVLVVAEMLLTSIGCGVMLSTGLVHVLADAQDNVEATEWMAVDEGEEPYPLALVMTLGSILLVFIFHMELHHRVDHMKQPVARMHVLEAGLLVHSVLVGFAIGATQDERDARALTIALIFHQVCEGFALGGAVKEAAVGAGIGWVHQAVMVVLFALSTPIGVIIGWFSVSNDEQANSIESVGTQAVFESVAAGVLICASLCEFMPQLYGMGAHSHGHEGPEQVAATSHHAADNVLEIEAEEPSEHDREHERRGELEGTAGVLCRTWWARILCHAGLCVGAAAMCVLAKWA
jgi:zinc transporter ZupT